MPVDPKLREVVAQICAHRGVALGAEVGAGAFKNTFGITLPDGSLRALKVYRRAGLDSRTEREVQAIARCSHPGVARFELIDQWSDGADEYVYSIEEFLSGGTLSQRLARGLLRPAEVRSLALKLVDAVAHIASLDLVHRDLKPDNVMFRSPGGEPVIVDFGLVRDLAQSSLTRTWLPNGPGTPLFAPPEQLNNEKDLIDWRADQFSLGILLAIAGYGNHPYQIHGLDPMQVVERVARREAAGPDFVAWTRSSALEPLATMVAPWPIGRFRTPAVLMAAWSAGGKR